MLKHTPGPWYWVGNSLESDVDYVLESNYTNRVAANRNLIEKSPDLYDMVGKLMRVIEDGISDPVDIDIYQQAKELLETLDGGAA